MALTHYPTFPILIIDTASTTTHVGLGSREGAWSWHGVEDRSGTALFQGVASCLRDEGICLRSVMTVIFCEGPGSMLGIRTAAMAIRTWKTTGSLADATLLAYTSLALAVEALPAGKPSQPTTVAIDARRKSWYCLDGDHRSPSMRTIRRVPVDEVDALAPPVFLPEGFPVWNKRPATWLDCPYSPRILEDATLRRTIVRPVDRPEAFLIDPPTYKRWVPTPMTKGVAK